MHKPGNPTNLRQFVIGVAYLLNCFHDFQALGGIETALLARKIFGQELVDATFAPILAVNAQWGYSRKDEAQTQCVPQSPENNEQDDIGGIFQKVERGSCTLVEGSLARLSQRNVR